MREQKTINIQPSNDWKVLITSNKFNESYPRLTKCKQYYPHKALGLFQLYECIDKIDQSAGLVTVIKDNKVSTPN